LLKWPFCIGEAERIVLDELERKLSEQEGREVRFYGQLGNFIEQAGALGIENLEGPARRPTVAAALEELERLFPKTTKESESPMPLL